MRFTRKALATSVIAAACTVPGALLLSATASADPVPVPAPAIPNMSGIPFLSQLTPANAPAMLQGLASAFTGAAGAPAATPATAPAPAATASVTLPQAPAAAAAAPAAAPAAASPATGLIPTADLNIPQVPGNPLPLPPELSFPGDLVSLMPAGTPLANLLPKAPIAAAPAVAAAAPVAAATAPALPAAANPLAGLSPLMFPVAALP
ncbi:hypothetical protein TUM20985_13220 [Mycobacterium antarcticum]|uniref:hypothetical protein n=1 Tax=unclassified Mycolicibacterium TaxID=2636767 RepID=UPI00239E4386|nr:MULTISPECIES: hypothetical protein [unclassified Mycolicibacterium]BDX30775.1 hypothetical protein TUM20985_13220 [Mycolicibacterium sp. TUM20985]GLP74139.1 hypothetical protein TUM20983_12490 [Mycolicibacterium sp. TUM20983]GLP79923.1 hypothetical protein TUM20984_13430 [Mycolicibacterium sp. TUM20984]